MEQAKATEERESRWYFSWYWQLRRYKRAHSAHLELLNRSNRAPLCRPKPSHSIAGLLSRLSSPNFVAHFFYLGCLAVPLDICILHWFPCDAERHSINGELFRQSSLCLFIDMSSFSDTSQRANAKPVRKKWFVERGLLNMKCPATVKAQLII